MASRLRRRHEAPVRSAAIAATAVASTVLWLVPATHAGVRAGSLGVGVIASQPTTQAGGVLQYQVGVANNGQTAEAPVTVTVSLDPARLTTLSLVFAGMNCSHTARTITCQIDSLAAGENNTFTVVARVAASATGGVLTKATAAAPGETATTQTRTLIDPKIRPADLALSLASSRGGAKGASWTWRITNRGPSFAPKTIFEEHGALSTNALTGAHASGGRCTIANLAGATVHCELGRIPAQSAVTVTVSAPSYHETGFNLVEHPSVASAVPDQNPANNGAGRPWLVPLKSR